MGHKDRLLAIHPILRTEAQGCGGCDIKLERNE